MTHGYLLRDRVIFVKADGSLVRDQLAASVQSGLIFSFDADLPVQEGDHFLRQLPSGLVEDYVVDDPGLTTGLGSIRDHFRAKVHRSGKPLADRQTVINQLCGHCPDLFSAMLEKVSSIDNEAERERIAGVIEEMAETEEAGGASFNEKYLNFLLVAADHMTAFVTFLPALTERLVSLSRLSPTSTSSNPREARTAASHPV